jgi:hypothetical protein
MFRLGLVLMMGIAFVAPAAAADGLTALFDTQSHNFGDVPYGPTVQHSFTIKNTTNQVLQIGGLRVSCGCVTPSASAYTIQPGKSATVNASMDTRRYHNPVTIFVTFVQPQFEEVHLLVSANVRHDIAMNPDRLEFGTMKRGSSQSVGTNISLNGGTQISEATCDSGYVQLSIAQPKQTGYGLSYELTARMRPDIPVGKWYTDVWIKTNNGSKFRVPVSVEVEPTLTITPGAIAFDEAHVGQPIKKSILVKGSQPFKIVDVKGGDATITAVATSKDAKATHLITVTFTPDHAGDFDKKLEIVTDLKDEGRVDVPVKGKAQP